MLKSRFIGYTAFFCVAMAGIAQALTGAPGPIDGELSLGWGNLVASFLRDSAEGFALAAVGAVIHFAPGGTSTLIRMFRIDQLLRNAVKAGINKTAGAVEGKVLTAKVGNEVIERALEYAAFHAPSLFKKLPLNEWRDKILARLTLGAEVSADPAIQGYVSTNRAG